VHGHGAVVRRWVDLVNTWVGPTGILAIVGILGAWRRRNVAVTAVTAVAVASALGYLVEPYSGGAAGGVPIWFISGMRFLLPTLLLGAALLAATLPTLVAAAAAIVALTWNLWWAWHRLGRSSVRPSTAMLAGALVVGIAVAGGLLALSSATQRSPEQPRPVRTGPARVAFVSAMLLLAFVGVLGAYHLNEHGTSPSRLAVLMNRNLGPYERLAALTEADDRSILGTNLHRRLVLLSPGGHANENTFNDPVPANVVYFDTNRFVPSTPNPPDPRASALLNAAIIKSGVTAIVVDSLTYITTPSGWQPPQGWCKAGSVDTTSLYLSETRVLPGTCRGR
jgi:hypothetical protein